MSALAAAAGVPVVTTPYDPDGYLVALMEGDDIWGEWAEPSAQEISELGAYITFARGYLGVSSDEHFARDARSNTLTVGRSAQGWSAHRDSWRRQGFITKPDYTPDVTGLRNLLADLGVSAYAARRRALT